MDHQQYISYVREEVNHEINRLKTLLKDSRIAEQERDVVLAMLAFYEDARTFEEMSLRGASESFISHRTRGTLRSAESTPRKRARAA